MNPISIDEEFSLRLLKQEDAQAIFNILDSERESLRQWLPFVDLTHKVEDIEASLKIFATPENPQFSILHKGKVVGLIGFKETERITRKTEIGYWLSPKCQGRGVMTKATMKLLEYAFLVMNMNRLKINVAVGNSKSRRIPEKLGFVKEGIERDGELLVDGVYADIVVYSMLRKEYLEKRENANLKISK